MRLSLPAVATLLLAACTSPGVGPVRTDAALRDPDPAKKLRAIRHMVAANDTRHLDLLAELLEDRDPTVRFVAARALARLSGRPASHPAVPSEDDAQAEADSWRAWLARPAGGSGR